MKKFVLSAVIFLFSISLFCQDYFNKKSAITRSLNLNNGFPQYDFYYGFETNGVSYTLAYRIDEDESNWNSRKYVSDPPSTRDLVLYRFVGVDNWVRVSNVVQVDYSTSAPEIDYGTHFSYANEHSFIILRGLGNPYVSVLDNGCVVMLITNDYRVTEKLHTWSHETETCSCCGKTSIQIGNKKYRYNAVVIFVPNGDGTYSATRFEPLNKKTKSPELVVSDALKIYESEDDIIIEIWNQLRCDANESDDYMIYKNESGSEVKIYYKNEFFTTLNFGILDGKVYYSGDYKMAQTL